MDVLFDNAMWRKCREYEELIDVVHYKVNTWHPCIIKSYMWKICREYAEGSIDKITSDIQLVPHAFIVMSRALHAYAMCETYHI